MYERLISPASPIEAGESISPSAPIDCASPTAVSLFSGCGGFDLGAAAAGFSTVYAVDSMADAAATLGETLPEADVVHGRVESVSALPKADLLIGGYPCQSFSMGGRRSPESDKRSELYKEFGRCLALIEPLYFVAENVSGMAALAKGDFYRKQIELFSSAGKKGYRIVSLGLV